MCLDFFKGVLIHARRSLFFYNGCCLLNEAQLRRNVVLDQMFHSQVTVNNEIVRDILTKNDSNEYFSRKTFKSGRTCICLFKDLERA